MGQYQGYIQQKELITQTKPHSESELIILSDCREHGVICPYVPLAKLDRYYGTGKRTQQSPPQRPRPRHHCATQTSAISPG